MRAPSPFRGPAETSFRLAAFLAWSAAIAAAWAFPSPFLGPRARVSWAARLTSAWGRGTLRALGVRVEVGGTPPRPPFFLAANHLGYLDVAVIAAHLPCAFVAKGEVRSWPVFGALAAFSGTVFIDRDSPADIPRVNRLLARRLDQGGGVCVFPEGTSTGGEPMAFRSPLLELPASRRLPVHYASLRYRLPRNAPSASRAMCWWGDMPFLPHFLRLFSLRGMEAELTFGPEAKRSGNRKALAAALSRAVRELLGLPVPPEGLGRDAPSRAASQAVGAP